MKKSLFSILCFLYGFPTTAQEFSLAQLEVGQTYYVGPWQVTKEVDMFDDSVSVSVLSMEKNMFDHGLESNPWLQLNCLRNKSLDLQITWLTELDNEGYYPITYRIGLEEPVTNNWLREGASVKFAVDGSSISTAEPEQSGIYMELSAKNAQEHLKDALDVMVSHAEDLPNGYPSFYAYSSNGVLAHSRNFNRIYETPLRPENRFAARMLLRDGRTTLEAAWRLTGLKQAILPLKEACGLE